MATINDQYTSTTDEELKSDYFEMYGSREHKDWAINIICWQNDATLTFDDICRRGIEIQLMLNIKISNDATKNVTAAPAYATAPAFAAATSRFSNYKGKTYDANYQKQTCTICDKKGHGAKSCYKNPDFYKCYKCDKKGHTARNCMTENNEDEEEKKHKRHGKVDSEKKRKTHKKESDTDSGARRRKKRKMKTSCTFESKFVNV